MTLEHQKTDIPIYRAKKINSDEYIEGFLVTYQGKYRIGYEDGLWIEQDIDPSTISIHFGDMIAKDSDRLLNGDKDLRIFASLREDGRGGDILKVFGHYSIEYKWLNHQEAVRFDFGSVVFDNTPFRDLEQHKKTKIIGIKK